MGKVVVVALVRERGFILSTMRKRERESYVWSILATSHTSHTLIQWSKKGVVDHGKIKTI